MDRALRLRTKYACALDDYCNIVDDFLDKHDIDCDYEDTHGGVELYVNPVSSEERIRQAIKNHKGRIICQDMQK